MAGRFAIHESRLTLSFQALLAITLAMTTATAASWEYQNDFFTIKISPLKHRTGSYNYSIGLNLPKFNPIIWGRTGICSNAAFKGLQQLRADVSAFARDRARGPRSGPEPPPRPSSASP